MDGAVVETLVLGILRMGIAATDKGSHEKRYSMMILALILIAAYNATAATMKWKMRWSVAVYWCLVAVYWMMKAM